MVIFLLIVIAITLVYGPEPIAALISLTIKAILAFATLLICYALIF
jgi:hypothetical protein